jgi:hypothetical protein
MALPGLHAGAVNHPGGKLSRDAVASLREKRTQVHEQLAEGEGKRSGDT